MTAPLTLADEILASLPAMMASRILGPRAGEVAERLSVDLKSVRAALEQLDAEANAKIVRRGRGGALHLVPVDYPGRICVICRREFTPSRAKTVTCSYSCARHLGWQNQDMRERHRESIRKAKGTPKARREQSKRSRRYCSDPQVREQMSELQRRLWADPEGRAARLNAIDRSWENAPERRAKASSCLKKRLWGSKVSRAKTIAAMHNSKRCTDRRRIVEIAKANPEMIPADIGIFVGRTSEAICTVLRRARRLGEIGVRPGDDRRAHRASVSA